MRIIARLGPQCRLSPFAATTGSVRGLLTGFASHRVPQGMAALETPDSEALLEQLAEAYVQMDLNTMSQFQQLATARMTGAKDASSAHQAWESTLLQAMGGGGGGGGLAAAPVAASPAASADAAAAADGAAAPSAKKAVEKNAFDVALKKYPAENKIKLIKELRSVCSMPIPQAKAAIEKCPGVIATNVSKEDAEKLKKLMQALGAEVELA